MSLIHNEQQKLFATWLNNVGVGCIVAGMIVPAVSILASPSPVAVVAGALVWVSAGIGLHYVARRVLRGLKE